MPIRGKPWMVFKVMNIFAKLEEGLELPSPEAMEALGEDVAEALPDNSFLALSGPLGVGKTTFTRGLARQLGIPTAIHSPTYSYYLIHQGKRQLVHLDAYRISNPDTLESLMLEEFLREPFLWVVEWPENIATALPPETIWLSFTILRPGVHRICRKKGQG
jgi:tRNA threonylcarbamoyladenosine biosynthesis protein TsaE